ncbi:MAG: SLC13 family permease [Gemmatimonadales bacterium]
MSPAVLTLIALLVAIALSIATRLNVGLVAFALAWVVGVHLTDVGADRVIGGFPVQLFLTLAGVTLLFAIAEANGTLENLARRAVLPARGRSAILPVLFFVIAFAVSTVGPGAISSVALVIPLAMAIGHRAGVPVLLTALMVTNGANAGNLSPVSSVGVIANGAMAGAGIGGHEAKVWFANFAAHLLVSAGALLAFGGWRRREAEPAESEPPAEPLTRVQWLTVGVVLAWIAAVLLFRPNLGLSAFAAAALLLASRAVTEASALRRMPWGPILMVSGMSTLVALLEVTGGMELFSDLLARLATPATVNGVIAFVTGTISTYSSTSGVVLPTFLPTAPLIVERLGGGDPLAVALSINVGSSLVDVSPLSTLGALCVAAVSDGVAAERLFRRLLIWGVSMTVVGAVICQVLAGPLARA